MCLGVVVPSRSPALRQAVAAVLILALTLAGVGRALATASETHAVVAGLTVPICHAGAGAASRPGVPGDRSRHDCCDQCALCAPALPPASATVSEPASVEHVAVHARALGWAPLLARARSPRLSQGPPAA